jgi:aspartyl protease family protein
LLSAVTIIRLAVIAGIVVMVAVLTPKLVPGLIAVVDTDEVVAESAVETPAVVAEIAVEPRQLLPHQAALDADRVGHFVTSARINGRSVEVMVDTGASIVALNAETARRLGVAVRKSDFTATIGTVNGTVEVAPVVLTEIRVGNITVRNVEAAVVPGDLLDVNLLGMSFLSRLSGFEIDSGELILTQ